MTKDMSLLKCALLNRWNSLKIRRVRVKDKSSTSTIHKKKFHCQKQFRINAKIRFVVRIEYNYINIMLKDYSET